MKLFILLYAVLSFGLLMGQTPVEYEVSFEKRKYHEAEIRVNVANLPEGPLTMMMSRSSPGRYALHEFAKNVYNVQAFDSKGNSLKISRPNPHHWIITGHDRTVRVQYTLFGDRGDGTYSEFDDTHAHMNIPATFMYPEGMEQRPIIVNFQLPTESNWKVATQLKKEDDTRFSAPNRYYFMDSPIEVSDFMMRSYKSESNGKEYNIRMALHHTGTESEADEYFESVKKIVEAQKEVYGELPDFDFGEYTFLACYMPGIAGDGMEHRNSTVLSTRRSLAEGGMSGNLGTVSHEFFHAWNVERIRPKSLEPFDFQKANMSGELWFAEGFTSYYTGLMMCRAGLITEERYIRGLEGTINAVVNGTGRNFFSPIEMSYRAPFVDAARSVDPTNTGTIFISYYTYGSALGLALDLSLRSKSSSYSLDGFMREVWQTYGKPEIPYEIEDLKDVLSSYTDETFANEFFTKYIYGSEAPDYSSLFNRMGILLEQESPEIAWAGWSYEETDEGLRINEIPRFEGPAYKAQLAPGDLVTKLGTNELIGKNAETVLSGFSPGETVDVSFVRDGVNRNAKITFSNIPRLKISTYENSKKALNKEMKLRRNRWLH